MSDPKGEKPHSDHPHEDEFEFEMLEATDEGPRGHDHSPDAHAAEEHMVHENADAPHPLDELGFHTSSEDFQFSGPAEDLDFTEPVDFTFPTEHVEAEAGSDSAADIPSPEHGGFDHLFGGEESAPHETSFGEEAAGEVEPVPELAASAAATAKVEEEPKPKRKRETPAWVGKFQWVAIGLLAAIGLIAPFVAILSIGDADTVSLIVNICFPVMLLLVPIALWRSSRRWMTPVGSALYTVLLAVGTAALIGGSWVEANELSHMKWEFSKTRVASGMQDIKSHPNAQH